MWLHSSPGLPRIDGSSVNPCLCQSIKYLKLSKCFIGEMQWSNEQNCKKTAEKCSPGQYLLWSSLLGGYNQCQRFQIVHSSSPYLPSKKVADGRGCTWALHISSLPIVGQHCSTKSVHLGIFLVLLPLIEQCDNREFVIVKRWQTFGSLLPSSSWTHTACGLIVPLFSWRMCLKFLCVKFVWTQFSCTLHRGRFSFPHEQKVFKTRDRVEPFLCSG